MLRCAACAQVLALESLQVFAPLGHALGLSAVSASMEDLCFQVCERGLSQLHATQRHVTCPHILFNPGN